MRSFIAIGLAVVACLCACNQNEISLLPNRAQAPPEIRDACILTEQKCSRCHDLQRILLAHYALVNWAVYVERMRRQPGSGITVADGKIILRCLDHIKRLETGAAASRPPWSAPDADPRIATFF